MTPEDLDPLFELHYALRKEEEGVDIVDIGEKLAIELEKVTNKYKIPKSMAYKLFGPRFYAWCDQKDLDAL